MKKEFLEMARITKPVGLRGEMRAQLMCDGPEMLTEFTMYAGKEHAPLEIISARPLKNEMAAIRVKGVDTIEQAEKLSNRLLYLKREDAELPEGTYFISELIGCGVYDADSGRLYGELDEVLQNGPADVYSIKTPEKKQLLFPAIPEVLLSVDVDEEKIIIRPLPNLFELEGEEDSDEN